MSMAYMIGSRRVPPLESPSPPPPPGRMSLTLSLTFSAAPLSAPPAADATALGPPAPSSLALPKFAAALAAGPPPPCFSICSLASSGAFCDRYSAACLAPCLASCSRTSCAASRAALTTDLSRPCPPDFAPSLSVSFNVSTAPLAASLGSLPSSASSSFSSAWSTALSRTPSLSSVDVPIESSLLRIAVHGALHFSSGPGRGPYPESHDGVLGIYPPPAGHIPGTLPDALMSTTETLPADGDGSTLSRALRLARAGRLEAALAVLDAAVAQHPEAAAVRRARG